MSNQSNGRKISQFVAQTSIPSDAQFTFISNNVNYRIAISDFQSSIGVTGTIEQAGNVLATPVLNVAGSVNKIRNLEDGPGVKTSVSPENGITIEHNFQSDSTGVEIVDDLTLASPKFRSLIAGSGINVSQSNGTIQIGLSATPASTKTVIVNQLSDFPSPVAGVITLADNTEYAIQNDISTSNRFVVGDNTVLSGSDSAVVTITYTGAGTMFTSVNSTWKIRDLTVSCASGTMLDYSGSGVEILQIIDSTIVADTLGTISGFVGMHVDDVIVNTTTDGLTFSGTCGVMLIEALLVTAAAGTVLDLNTAVLDSLSIDNCFVTLNGSSVFLDGAAASANIASGGLGTVHNCRFFGAGTPVQTIVYNDIRWQFLINDDIQDTHSDSLLSLVANATVTTITAANTPVLIAGTWNLEHASKFTQTAAGRSTYAGIKDIHVDFTASFSAEPVTGTNKTIGFYIAINGTEVSNSEAKSVISAGGAKRTTVVWRVAISTGDYIEAFVENETDTTDILVSDAVLRIS